MPTVLLTGFNAFGGDAVNPSWLAVQALHGQTLEGHRVVAAQLPTEFAASGKRLTALLRQHRPLLILCVGLAGGRGCLSLERVAINLQDARISDNTGFQPIDKPVVLRGPAAYFSTLPIKAMRLAIEKAGVSSEISQTAGTFVCNHVFYVLMHQLHRAVNVPSAARGGFIHVPYMPDQGTPSLALEEMVRGLRAACTSALTTAKDISQESGALS